MEEKTLIKSPLIVHASAPLRLNDIGGWTDTWFSGEGRVLNLAISPPVEVLVKVFENKARKKERVLVHAEDYGDTFLVNPDKPSYDVHPFLQAAINSLPITMENKLEIHVFSRVPAGSSIGTSAAVCIALLGALSQLTSRKHSLDEIISLAHRVETDKLGLQSGIQDQICAAYGGVCFIHMVRYPQAVVDRLPLDEKIWQELNLRLCLIYLGRSHSSSALHEEVISSLEKAGPHFGEMRRLGDLADKAKECLLQGDLESYGKVMVQNNECQRSLHPRLISEEADSVIEIAKKHRATGWKVNGAGGKGGSLTILSSPVEDQKVRMLTEIDSLGQGIRYIPISLSKRGLTVERRDVEDRRQKAKKMT